MLSQAPLNLGWLCNDSRYTSLVITHLPVWNLIVRLVFIIRTIEDLGRAEEMRVNGSLGRWHNEVGMDK